MSRDFCKVLSSKFSALSSLISANNIQQCGGAERVGRKEGGDDLSVSISKTDDGIIHRAGSDVKITSVERLGTRDCRKPSPKTHQLKLTATQLKLDASNTTMTDLRVELSNTGDQNAQLTTLQHCSKN